jgi:hypothetical protein
MIDLAPVRFYPDPHLFAASTTLLVALVFFLILTIPRIKLFGYTQTGAPHRSALATVH